MQYLHTRLDPTQGLVHGRYTEVTVEQVNEHMQGAAAAGWRLVTTSHTMDFASRLAVYLFYWEKDD